MAMSSLRHLVSIIHDPFLRVHNCDVAIPLSFQPDYFRAPTSTTWVMESICGIFTMIIINDLKNNNTLS